MSAVATPGEIVRPAPTWSGRRKMSFSPFDPNTPHLRFAVVSILVLWLIVLSVINFLPRSYASKSTLIVPGATQAVNVSLDRIGQTTSSPASAYNTVALSPKVVYKEMLMSEEVRSEAAAALGLSLSQFGAPRIKLVDETALINIEIRGRNPRVIHVHHQALIAALQKRLDRLRADELEQRTAAVKENMKFYETNLADARNRITRLQETSGLQTEAQFNEVALTLIRRTQRLAELKADLERIETELENLTTRLGIDSKTSAVALKMVADPTLAKWITDYNEAVTLYRVDQKRLGAENPYLIHLQRRAETVKDALQVASSRFGISDPRIIQVLMLINQGSQQADLMKQQVSLEGAVTGRRAEIATVQVEVAELNRQHARLGRAASELEDLKKSQQVAEAVFSTAMARINTTKSDIYGSYPLIQTLAAPSLPDQPAGTQGLYGIAGGVLGTLLLALGWFLAWLRTGSGQKTLKSA
jgi:uncharacterized protein involved in exopolysaccharide biosynthesis